MVTSRPFLLSQLLPAAADRDPHGPALVDGDRTLDREQLATRVARLGTTLREHGVEAGDRVVVFAPKSAESFVGMHGALHAGAIAAPVDPLAPAGVIDDVVRGLEPRAVVLAAPTAARWPGTADAMTVGAPVPEGAARRGPHVAWSDVDSTEPLGPARRLGDDLAYLITTSGSTGRPKSIAHTHTSGLRYAELAAACFGLRPDDRMASVAPFHFDQSTFELYAGPAAGAATVLVPDAVLRFPASVAELLERERVTTWYSVPTILRQLLDRGALDRRDLTSLRRVLFGGELFPPAELRQLMELLPAAVFSNVYGPAEVNQCTHHHLDRAPEGDEAVPIGRPWDDTDVLVVDDDDRELAGAARGTLLVRTATAMAGYWRRPDLDERAWSVRAGDGGRPERWYRTGDVVERDAAGVLTFVGRVDRQVKVRGVRVELEAIEAVLDSVDGVTGSAAVVSGDALVAVVETSGSAIADEVQRALRIALPPAAVPDRVDVVERLPRTTSGKVDAGRTASMLSEGADTETDVESAANVGVSP